MDNKKIINDWEECPICGNEVYLDEEYGVWACDTCGWDEPVEYEDN